MSKHFFLALFLFGCHSNSDADSHLKVPPSSDTAIILTPENVDSKLKTTTKHFNKQQPFEILSITNTLNRNTTDTDTSKCSSWTLTKKQIEKIIKNSEPIDGTTWDLSFLVLTCTKSVALLQNGQQFDININAAAFFSVNNGDTTILFGDYNKSDRKYFIEGPDNR